MKGKKTGLVIGLCVLLVVTAAGSIFFYLKKTNDTSKEIGLNLSPEVLGATSIELYHPDALPQSITFANSETKIERDAVFTRFIHPNGQLVITQQKLPPQKFQFVDASENYQLPIGRLYILNNNYGTLQAMIETDTTLIFINADSAVGLSSVKELANSLARQQN